MSRVEKEQNKAMQSVLREAEQSLLAAFEKSQQNKHSGGKGNARAEALALFLKARLPGRYAVATSGEVVDHADRRSGEIDIMIYDGQQNVPFSASPLWLPAEALLAYVEVKSILTVQELEAAFAGARKVDALRPFGKPFALKFDPGSRARCFRTLFAYKSNLRPDGWLAAEWERIQRSAQAANCTSACIDRVVVLGRGIISPPSLTGADKFEVATAFHQWFTNLVNFLTREAGRRRPMDWKLYTKGRLPGWREL